MYDIRAGWLVKKLKTKKKEAWQKESKPQQQSETPRTLYYSPFIFFGLERSYHPINLYMYIQLCSRPVVFAPRAENEVMIG